MAQRTAALDLFSSVLFRDARTRGPRPAFSYGVPQISPPKSSCVVCVPERTRPRTETCTKGTMLKDNHSHAPCLGELTRVQAAQYPQAQTLTDSTGCHVRGGLILRTYAVRTSPVSVCVCPDNTSQSLRVWSTLLISLPCTNIHT